LKQYAAKLFELIIKIPKYWKGHKDLKSKQNV